MLSSKGTNEQMTTTSTTKEADGTITNVYFDGEMAKLTTFFK